MTTPGGLAPTSHSWVLDWNTPAIDFAYRVTGDALGRLTAGRD